MVRHPEVLAKAQAEVDSVVGHSRLPDFSDRPAMPYIEAMLSECLRYATPAPLSALPDLNYARYEALIAPVV
jgi:cytochrome P450